MEALKWFCIGFAACALLAGTVIGRVILRSKTSSVE